MSPELHLQHVHLLIRKPRLYCPVFVLGDDPAHPEERLSLTGEAGLQDDRSIRLAAKIESLAVSPWLPEKLRAHVRGQMSGKLDYQSTGTGLETAQANGSIAVTDGVIHALPAIEQYVKSTGSPDPGDLHLQVCQTDIRWEKGAVTAENFQMEAKGVFRIAGHVTIATDKTLSGGIPGRPDRSLFEWLPTARTAIFTENEGDYRTTTVRLSGTLQKPRQDLSARVLKEISKSPLVAVKLFFNSL